ncbi:nucleotide-diphospho-sugar transferase [Amylostereum chailletii]|nr:nucleotide-diphospho-sugar transferase [Amylostereum chailletii]
MTVVPTTKEEKYLFTTSQDWFSTHKDLWRTLFPRIESAAPRALEIGSWEGRSATFLLDELCGDDGDIVCIDHFDLMRTEAGQERYAKVLSNLTATGRSFRIMDQFSVPALMTLLEENMEAAAPGFDFIYVDGSHEADDTFLDGELVWRLARKGAVVIFDDYEWSTEPTESRHHPKRGIDAFMVLHKDEYECLSNPAQYQMVLQKTSDMRIGFLMKDRVGEKSPEYGINVAYTTDEAYAMPTAVSLRSLLKNTKGRISAYIVTCGVADETMVKIRSSLPERDDFTLKFIKLPDDSLAVELGMVWAKVDMIHILPIERVLYLDADTLVRSNVRPLWDTDLKGKSIAAAVDVGFPTGHEAMEKVPYFNAGMLLVNLAQVRSSHVKLVALSRNMDNHRFRDQYALNVHFRGDWFELGLRWNSQGLGTYANQPSAEREKLSLDEMVDPAIVHFTGHVHPGMDAILNPWGQPYTAKPWGYAGAPGHPHAEEWWRWLELTSWKGYRDSDAFRKICEEEMEKAQFSGIDKFVSRVERGRESR